MQKITHWEARRAGGRITIHGRDEKGAPIRIVGVDTIKAPAPRKMFQQQSGAVAKDRHGTEYELA